MKSYILVAGAILFATVALPAPASALSCVPDAPDVSDDLRCATANLIQCTGEIGQTCNDVGATVDDAIDAVEYAEETAGDVWNEARRLIHYHLP